MTQRDAGRCEAAFAVLAVLPRMIRLGIVFRESLSPLAPVS